MARNALIQVRRDTAANWTSANPTLAAGEQGFETDTGKLKIGTGSTAWTSLLYTTDASDITGTTLASNVVSSSLTSVGTLGSLTVTGATTSGSFVQGTDYLSPYQGFRNAIINGSFNIWQRGTSLTGYAYTADRWLAYNASAVNTISRQAASLSGFQYCARVQRNSGATSTGSQYLVQAVESVNSYYLQGKPVILSFWARKGANYSSSSSVLSANIETSTGTDQSYIGAWAGSSPSALGTVTLTTTWQKFTISSGIVPLTANQVAVAFYYTPVGTAGAADYFEITGVQLEQGSVATPFEQRPIQTELALCQRYYQIGRLAASGYGSVATVDSGAYGNFSFPTRMRITPTITELTKALGGSPAGYASATTYIDVSGFGYRYHHGAFSGSGNLSFDLTWSAGAEL